MSHNIRLDLPNYTIITSGISELSCSLKVTHEDNADVNLKRTIMGREVVLAITNGKLDFGMDRIQEHFSGIIQGDGGTS